MPTQQHHQTIRGNFFDLRLCLTAKIPLGKEQTMMFPYSTILNELTMVSRQKNIIFLTACCATVAACASDSSEIDKCNQASSFASNSELHSAFESKVTPGTTESQIAVINGIKRITPGRLAVFEDDELVPVQFFTTIDAEGTKSLHVLLSIDPTAADVSSNWPQLGNFKLFKSAYASCAPVSSDTNRLASDVDISDIEITSNLDYDALHPAGTNLADIISLIEQSRFIGIDQYSTPNSANGVSIENFLKDKPMAPLSFILKFNSQSTTPEEQILTVAITIDNGQKMFVETSPAANYM